MRAGTLDTRVALQRKTLSQSSSGDVTEAWTTLVERWAELTPITGEERNGAQQFVAREQTRFTLRWSQAIDDLSPLDRIVCPASDASASPEVSRSVYDIITVHEVTRRDMMTVLAARRVA